MPFSAKSPAASVAQHSRWARARRTPILDREPVVQASLRHPITPSQEFESKHAVAALQDSPLSANPIRISPTAHKSRPAILKRDSARINASTAIFKTPSPIPIDFYNKLSDRVAATTLKPRRYTRPTTLSEEVTRLSRLAGRMLPGDIQKKSSPEHLMNVITGSRKRCLSRVKESALASQQLPTIELPPDQESSLDRRKVQRIVAGHSSQIISHAQNISSLPKSDKRPFTGTTSLEADYNPGINHMPDPNHSLDPFAEEADFEKNISAGFLSECPTGSSTPKLMVSKPCPELSDEAYNERARSESNSPYSETLLPLSHETRSSTESVNGGRVKKHPSPSKKALEDLEIAFAIYTKLKPLENGDDTDELAMDYRPSLSASDCNRKMRQCQKEPDGMKPAPLLATSHNYQRRRRCLPYRPTPSQDRDIDDLQ
ncbi:hypothetical protein NQ176_g3129 [Zarea fungicola]|uniref:Uncharacterized protein n=1 Tax=Zarea fungicola TaxID=93591 RepID=A0ACC1NL53_9HYPO|nr:hypothetical protein NQ176_g3129 [Lecanicillium fungicola]